MLWTIMAGLLTRNVMVEANDSNFEHELSTE